MRLSTIITYLCVTALSANAASIPDGSALSLRAEDSAAYISREELLAPENTLEKRKGGGGKSGGGGGGGGGEKSGGGGGSTGRTSSSSAAGGRTVSGSGPKPAYGGGRYYGGGATAPYTAGARSPLGLAPFLILPATALVLFPGLWLYGVYSYPYSHPYTFVNQTLANSTNPNGVNQTLAVDCLCQQYSVCGCDNNNDTSYLNDLVGNGSYAALNKSLVQVSENGSQRTLAINGSLPNGTTASGGTDSAAIRQSVLEYSGYWVMGAIVLYTVSFLN